MMNIKIKFKPICFLVFAILFLTNISASAKPKPHRYYAVVHSENHRFKGLLENVTEKGLTIDYMGKSKFISAESIERIKIKRGSSLQRFALIGSAGGLLAGAAVYKDGNQKGKLSVLALPVMLVAGTLAGTTVGALVNTVTYVKKYQISSATEYRNLHRNLIRYSAESQSSKN